MKLGIRVENGDLQLVGSGTVLVYANKPLILHLKDNDPQELRMVINFVYDSNVESSKVVSRLKGKQDLELDFINFKGVNPTYNDSPWQVGHAFNRKLYLAYNIIGGGYSTKQKCFNYSFYLGKEKDNG